MKKGPLRPVITIFLFSSWFAGPLAAQQAEHPSLFFKTNQIPSIKQNIDGSEWMRQACEVLSRQANKMLEYRPEPYAYMADYGPNYAHDGNGDWKKSGILGRVLEKRVGTLGIAGYLSGDRRYFDKAIEIMMASAEASDPDEWYGHLQRADGARGYAIGYDLLDPYMNDHERSIVRKEIDKVASLLYDYNGVWSKSLPDANSQNHTAVHYGALGLCALVLGDKPEWQALATKRTQAYIGHFIDDTGYGTEGMDYTNYGLLGVVPYAVALQRKTGVDLLAEQPGMHLVPDQMIWKMQPWGNEVIAMNDAPTTLGSSAGLMYLISHYQLREALWAWLQIEGEEGGGSFGGGRKNERADNRPPMGDGLSLPFVLLWGDSKLEPRAPTELSHHFSSGRVFMRDRWGDPLGSLVSFTSGIDYHHAHNHSDENAFTFSALGEEFALDPGRYPKSTRSHNAILVNGMGQINNDSQGRILDYKESDIAVYVKGDAKEAYTPAPDISDQDLEVDTNLPRLGIAERQLLYVRGEQPYLLIVDNIQTEDEAVNEYTWLLHTDNGNAFQVFPKELRARIVGSKRGALCDVNFLWPKDNVVVEESDLSNAFLPENKKMSTIGRLLANHYKELTATTTAKNPHFIALLVAREGDSVEPVITTEGDAKKMEVHLKFSNGATDTIHVTPERITFNRALPR